MREKKILRGEKKGDPRAKGDAGGNDGTGRGCIGVKKDNERKRSSCKVRGTM